MIFEWSHLQTLSSILHLALENIAHHRCRRQLQKRQEILEPYIKSIDHLIAVLSA